MVQFLSRSPNAQSDARDGKRLDRSRLDDPRIADGRDGARISGIMADMGRSWIDCWWCDRIIKPNEEPTHVRTKPVEGGFLLLLVPINQVQPGDNVVCPDCVEKLSGERPPDIAPEDM